MLLLMVAGAACGPAAAPADDLVVEWKMTPPAPLVDSEARIEVTLLDKARQPVRGATVQIEAFMSHPGMAPVLEAATEHGNGLYVASLRLSMAGPWSLVARAELAGRRPIRQLLGEVSARPAS